ncbi:hypothetical protein M378DRAFT_161532, partial [Amanita muscaria Koide BX008]
VDTRFISHSIHTSIRMTRLQPRIDNGNYRLWPGIIDLNYVDLKIQLQRSIILEPCTTGANQV